MMSYSVRSSRYLREVLAVVRDPIRRRRVAPFRQPELMLAE